VFLIKRIFQDHSWSPSFVAFAKNGKCLTGLDAKRQFDRNPSSAVYDVTRLIGRKFDDASVQEDAKDWPFKVCEHLLFSFISQL
jgi:molecular chaperone DnaK (HSP70)